MLVGSFCPCFSLDGEKYRWPERSWPSDWDCLGLMPIAVEARIACVPALEGIAGARPERKGFDSPAMAGESSSSSSIGENSDGSGAVWSGSDGQEAQSALKGALASLDSLEESLPIRRGISKFYCGKSKSYTSLADVAYSAAKDLGKADNAYSSKRKNLLAYKTIWGRAPAHDNLLRCPGGGISKRPAANSNRSTLARAATMSRNLGNGDVLHNPRPLLPLHPPGKPAACASPLKKCSFPMRSFSMMDLHRASNS